ncbi:MAG: serine hydrolase [Candidatus Kerfeldbacteria bacterium]|nr:serine hydrolase [Candidatus Kerfeldbacteria bacterium]
MSKHFREKTPVSNAKNLLTLVGLILAAAVLVYTYAIRIPGIRSSSERFANQYPFLNPSAALIEKANLLVNFQPLREQLTSAYEQRGDYRISLYFEYLPTGANISLNKDERIWPASLIKIPVAMAAMKKVETGTWKPTNELVILDEDKDGEYGTLYQQPIGTTLTIERLLKESLANSDNTAHFVLLRNLDGAELEDVYTHLGLDDIISALKQAPKEEETDNRITAKRYSIFFRSLYNATYLTPEYSQRFLDILKDAPREFLSRGLPPEIVFVHKTGVRTDEAVRADAGIVYVPNRPYLLTVMMQKKDGTAPAEGEVEKLFEEISKMVYTYVAEAR